MKIKYYIPALLCMMILFTSLPVSAAEVSGNDANNGIMLLSDDYGIATTDTYYPNSVTNYFVEKKLYISKFSDVINVDVDLFDIYFSNDTDYNSLSNCINIYYNSISPLITNNSSSPSANILDYRYYIIINGKKYYFDNNWTSIVFDEYISGAVGKVGCELSFSILTSDLDLFFDFNMSGTSTSNSSGTTENYQYTGTIYTPYETATKEFGYTLTISWNDFQWDIYRSVDTSNSLLKLIWQHCVNWSSSLSQQLTTLQNNIVYEIQVLKNNIITKLDSINSSINNKFSELFSKMDEEQDEIINGYDDTQASDSNNELSGSLNTYQDTEKAVTDEAFSGIGEYTVTEQGAQSFATQFLTVFPLVASMMQSMYQSASSFNIVISVIFTTIIASMVIGLFRFYRR